MTNSFKYYIFVLVFLTSISTFAYIYKGQDGGNGGGGIVVDGHVMTFKSAGVKLEGDNLKEVPGLQILIDSIMDLNIDFKLKQKLLNSFSGENRKYYKSKPISLETYDRIISVYAELLNVDPKKLTLFAVTDSKTRSTFLLADFFKLKPVEQAAVLFHEAVWIFDSKTNYYDTVKVEMAYQAYVENPMNEKARYEFLEVLSEILNDKKVFLDFFSTFKLNRETPESLFGSEFLSCSRQSSFGCTDKALEYLLSQDYKGASYAQKALYEILKNGAVFLRYDSAYRAERLHPYRKNSFVQYCNYNYENEICSWFSDIRLDF